MRTTIPLFLMAFGTCVCLSSCSPVCGSRTQERERTAVLGPVSREQLQDLLTKRATLRGIAWGYESKPGPMLMGPDSWMPLETLIPPNGKPLPQKLWPHGTVGRMATVTGEIDVIKGNRPPLVQAPKNDVYTVANWRITELGDQVVLAAPWRHRASSNVFDPHEIVWFGVSDSALVACRADGLVTCWRIPDGRLIATFKIKGYTPTNRILALSNTASPLLGIYGMTEDGAVVLTILDASTGKERGRITGAKSDDIWGLGFDSTGKHLFYFTYTYSDLRRNMLCVSIENKGVKWQVDGHWWWFERTQVFSGGQRIATSRGGHLVTKNTRGDTVWKKAYAKRSYFEPVIGRAINQPSHRLLVCYVSDLTSGEGKFIGMDNAGVVAWTKRQTPYHSLLAVSTGGGKQAFETDGHIVVTSLPSKTEVRLESRAPADVRFTPNGKYVVTLPALQRREREWTPKNDALGSIVFRRESNTIRIHDVTTGKQLHSWSLQKAVASENSVGPQK